MAGEIRRLDEAVVNRIAAGEVIQRPANALKELIENCLDAKATNIQVTVKQGGMKLLQIQDNGTGIRKQDLTIVCERFTTSKLTAFEDLSSIATYGFRGEALASISHVAHLTITTRTEADACAWRGCYGDGELRGKLKACAGNRGTVISVEDLFYNMVTRRRALRSPAEEHGKVAEVVTRYAVHNSGVGFTLKKHGETGCDVRTPQGSSVQENIRQLYGGAVARELLELKHENKRLGYSASGHVTNANFNQKRCVFLLFINHRLVESPALRRALEAVYSSYLPKNSHPFLYLNLEITPSHVDVNVHPTKHEVHFLHEEEIIQDLTDALERVLLSSKQSRTFYAQTLLPCSLRAESAQSGEKNSAAHAQDQNKTTYAHSMVRTDSKAQKLDSFVTRVTSTGPTPAGETATSTCAGTAGTSVTSHTDTAACASATLPATGTDDDVVEMDTSGDVTVTPVTPGSREPGVTPVTPGRRDVRLTSVLSLRAEVETQACAELRDVIVNHTFVGVVDAQYALIQHLTDLYLADTTRLSRALFYQLLLSGFGNFGLLRLTEPAPLTSLLTLALEQPGVCAEADGPRDQLAAAGAQLLQSKAAMLEDYFSLEIDAGGRLGALPLLLEGYVPALEGLPEYLLRLTTDVDWADETRCFRGVCEQTADFYSVQRRWWRDGDVTAAAGLPQPDWRHVVEHVVFPALRGSLRPPRRLAEDQSLLRVANLHDLYKVFERC